jgi:hypothetical protein
MTLPLGAPRATGAYHHNSNVALGNVGSVMIKHLPGWSVTMC